MKKLSKLVVALCATLALVFGFASCDNGTETEYVEKTVTETVTEYVDKTYAAAPTFTSSTSDDQKTVTVTIATRTEGAAIHYTTDGSTPTEESTVYTAELSFTADAKVQAIAVKEGLETSPVSVFTVSIQNDFENPTKVTNLCVDADDQRVILSWKDATDEDIFGYEVSYDGSEAINARTIQPLAKTSMIVPQGAQCCYVGGLTNGTTYTFTVKAMDTSGNKSDGVSISVIPSDNAHAVTIATTENGTVSVNKTKVAKGDTVSVVTKADEGNVLKSLVITDASSNAITWGEDGTFTMPESDVTITAEFGTYAVTVGTTQNGSVSANPENTIPDTEVTLTAAPETGYKVKAFTVTDSSGNTVQTTKTDLNTCTFAMPVDDVSVSAEFITLTKIELTSAPVKTSYKTDEEFDSTGMVVTATYSDGSTEDVTAECTTDFDSSSAAKDKTITVSYTDTDCNVTKTATFTVDIMYVFHDEVMYLPAGTDGTYGTSGTYVLFGDWPQAAKADDVTIKENAATVTMGGNTYYLGSDNNYYYEYSYNNRIEYYRVEPIKWRILTNDYNGKKLLFAEDILGTVTWYADSDATPVRKLGEKTISHNDWKYSNIRAYLNGTNNQFVLDGGTATDNDIDWTGKGFLQSAFTTKAQSLIVETSVKNEKIDEANSYYDESGDYFPSYSDLGNTLEKVFHLSYDELFKSDYFGSNNDRTCVSVGYASSTYGRQRTYTANSYHTRTLLIDDFNQEWSKMVNEDGSDNSRGWPRSDENLRPALCIE